MRNTPFLLVAAALTVFTSCGPNKKDTVTSTVPATPNSTLNVPATSGENNSIQPTTPPNQANLPTTAVALNPAHGMPNHRCDIAVGAPLNSEPQTNVPAAPKLPTPNLTLPAQGSYAAGTNPAHGQPGHDCTIPVGAPLKK